MSKGLFDYSLSIIIPAYNEENRIYQSLIDIVEHMTMSELVYEVIVVNDGSVDKTIDVVKSVQGNIQIINNTRNFGKGYSVRAGIKKASNDIVLITDADLSTPIEELNQMVEKINKGYDLVIASRNLYNSEVVVKQPFYRQFMGKIFPFFVNFLLIPKIKDTQCGFKLLKLEVAKKVSQVARINKFSFDVEYIFIALSFGFTLAEMPVKWFDKKGTKVRFLRDGLIMLLDLFKIKINYLLGRYDYKEDS